MRFRREGGINRGNREGKRLGGKASVLKGSARGSEKVLGSSWNS